MLRDLKNNVQKELNRAIQDNINYKYGLDSVKENKRIAENTLRNLQENYTQSCLERDVLNNELLQLKQEYDELLQLYEVKKQEDLQLKNLYKHHFK